MAWQHWQQQETQKAEPDLLRFGQITLHLGMAEHALGNYPSALSYFQLLKPVSPNPEAIQKYIDAVRDDMKRQ